MVNIYNFPVVWSVVSSTIGTLVTYDDKSLSIELLCNNHAGNIAHTFDCSFTMERIIASFKHCIGAMLH